ncbi:anti-sigma-I factor RsgI family protein [Lacrimispora algidixylanolytica]|uniref:Anti-sigma factor RsgI-like middle domain-containing protein n=1 Tax=Lacrimispora algidixylanolytica TaxID=94868 RepID=A0A419T480_9FIRM|nr:hypothetical protein [Lacrimispora algidixylanolytica]RKD32223.1 hypothetical protein BET01_18255 [Lacrimispora algidixylanolytica]
MNQSDHRQLNKKQIEACLTSATQDLIPDVLDHIDLSTPQETVELHTRSIFVLRRRVIASLIAACFCMIALAGGTYTYQNGRVDSVIGIDVNPSVELSVNKRNKVLSAQALNEDARNIMEQMDLKGVDLNVAVNAVIGAMVTNGYLTDADNAILVTVANDSVKKAKNLRSTVVGDIKTALKEQQLEAVVYDQQAIEEDQVKSFALDYGISYGKAYFLKELMDQNSSLTLDDMKDLASLNMEQIAKVITERSYAVGGRTEVTEETKESTSASETTTQKNTMETVSTEEATSTQPSSETESQTATHNNPTQVQTSSATPSSSAEEDTTSEQDNKSGEKIKIDYVDYEDGVVMVYFKTKVKWKNPTVSVKDEDGNTYSAKVSDTDSESCEIDVTGLSQGKEYTFVLGGISPKIGKQVTVKGVFETPVVGEEDSESEETTETQATTAASTAPTETEKIEQSTGKITSQ